MVQPSKLQYPICGAAWGCAGSMPSFCSGFKGLVWLQGHMGMIEASVRKTSDSRARAQSTNSTSGLLVSCLWD